jgi:hypothetical protein
VTAPAPGVWDEIEAACAAAGKAYAYLHRDSALGFCSWCGWCLDCHPEHRETGPGKCDRSAA